MLELVLDEKTIKDQTFCPSHPRIIGDFARDISDSGFLRPEDFGGVYAARYDDSFNLNFWKGDVSEDYGLESYDNIKYVHEVDHEILDQKIEFAEVLIDLHDTSNFLYEASIGRENIIEKKVRGMDHRMPLINLGVLEDYSAMSKEQVNRLKKIMERNILSGLNNRNVWDKKESKEFIIYSKKNFENISRTIFEYRKNGSRFELAKLIIGGVELAPELVTINKPYKGGYVTKKHGPKEKKNVVQIELNRDFYAKLSEEVKDGVTYYGSTDCDDDSLKWLGKVILDSINEFQKQQ
jgi:hypothetical protein